MMEKPITGRRMLIILTLLVLVLAMACMLLGFSSGLKILYSIGLSKPAGSLAAQQVWIVVVMCLGALIQFAIGIGLSLKGATEALMKSSVPGSVRSSVIRSFPWGEDTGYRVCSVVSYYIDGVAYEREGRHHFMSSSESEARKRLADIHPGDSVKVYYKPGDPCVIELDNPPAQTVVPMVIGALLISTGLVVAFMVGCALEG